MEINVGDSVIIYDDKLKRATVTEVWPSRYQGEEKEAGVVEVEFDDVFLFGKTRKIIDADHIRSVKPRVKEG